MRLNFKGFCIKKRNLSTAKIIAITGSAAKLH